MHSGYVERKRSTEKPLLSAASLRQNCKPFQDRIRRFSLFSCLLRYDKKKGREKERDQLFLIQKKIGSLRNSYVCKKFELTNLDPRDKNIIVGNQLCTLNIFFVLRCTFCKLARIRGSNYILEISYHVREQIG